MRLPSLFVLLAAGSVVHGQDAGLHVVVKFDENRLLSSSYRLSFCNDLSQTLTNSLRGLTGVRVVVVNELRRDDQLAEWDRAFQVGMAKIDRLEMSHKSKTHFIIVGFQDGVYRVQSRQFDGQLGWPSPVTRDARSPEREALVRLATHQILMDFGLTGVITDFDGERAARIRIVNSLLLSARIREWVHPADVFALVQVNSNGRSTPIPQAYFVATGFKDNGDVVGKIESRFAKPLNGWESGQFRAIKLGTTNTSLHLRLVGPNGSQPPDMTIRLSAAGLATGDSECERGYARAGQFDSTCRYEGMAYARINLGERPVAKIPVPIINNEPVVFEIHADPGGEAIARELLEARTIQARAKDLASRLDIENVHLRTLIATRKNRQALTKIKGVLRQCEEELPALTADAVLLRSRSVAAMSMLDEVDRQIRDLRQFDRTLRITHDELEKSVTASNLPEAEQRRRELGAQVARAEQDVVAADYDRAIETLENVLKVTGEWPDVQSRLNQLKRNWAIQSDAHRSARKFVYDSFSMAATVEEIARLIAEARSAVEVCKKVGDKLTLRKVELVLIRAATSIDQRNAEFHEGVGNPQERDSLRQISQSVKAMLEDIEKFTK